MHCFFPSGLLNLRIEHTVSVMCISVSGPGVHEVYSPFSIVHCPLLIVVTDIGNPGEITPVTTLQTRIKIQQILNESNKLYLENLFKCAITNV